MNSQPELEYNLSDEDSQHIKNDTASPALRRLNLDMFDDSLAVYRSPQQPPRYFGTEENGATLHPKSLDALLHAGQNTPQTTSKADISWSSSLATPRTTNKCISELNTEERKVFLPSVDAHNKCPSPLDEEKADNDDGENFNFSYDHSTPLSRLQTSTSSRLSKRLFSPHGSSLGSDKSKPSPYFSSLPSTLPISPNTSHAKELFERSPDIFSPTQCHSNENCVIDSQVTPGRVQKFNFEMSESQNYSEKIHKIDFSIKNSELKSKKDLSHIHLIHSEEMNLNKNDEIINPNKEIQNTESVVNKPTSPIIGKGKRQRKHRVRNAKKKIEVSVCPKVSTLEEVPSNSVIPSTTTIALDLDRPKSPVLNFTRASKKRRKVKRQRSRKLELEKKLKLEDIKQNEEVCVSPKPLDALSQQDIALEELDKDISQLIGTIWHQNKPIVSPKKEDIQNIQCTSSNKKTPESSTADDRASPTCKDLQLSTPVSKRHSVKISTQSFSEYSMMEIDKVIENSSNIKTPTSPKSLKKKICFSKTCTKNSPSNIENTVKTIKKEAANKKTQMLYPKNKLLQINPNLSITDLKQSAIILENAKLKPQKISSSLPINQNEAVKFSDMPQEEENTDDVELLINLLDADEALFGTEVPEKIAVTSTPFIKHDVISDMNLSPIVARDIKLTPIGTTPVTRKNKSKPLHLLPRIEENISTTPYRKKNEPIVSTPITEVKLEINETPINKLQGFSTASGKKLTLSEIALLKAQKMFDNEELPEISNENVDILPPFEPKQLFNDSGIKQNFIGFSTAAGKIIKPSTSAIEKAKGLFSEDIDIDLTSVSLCEENLFDDDSLIKLTDACTSEIQHKNDSNFKEDNNLIELADNLMKSEVKNQEISSIDEELIEEMNKLEETAIKNLTSNDMKGFATASGKVIVINEESFQKAHNLFSTELQELEMKQENDMEDLNGIINVETSIKTSQNIDKDLSVEDFETERALTEKSNEITSVINKSVPNLCTVESSPRTIKLEPITSPVTVQSIYKTSPATSVQPHTSVELKSEKKSKNLTQETFDDHEMDSLLVQFCEYNESKNEETLGFSTASGKKIKISQDLLLAAKQQFEEEINITNIKKDDKKRPTTDLELSDLQQNKRTKLTQETSDDLFSVPNTVISQGTMEAAEVLVDLLKYDKFTQEIKMAEANRPELSSDNHENQAISFTNQSSQDIEGLGSDLNNKNINKGVEIQNSNIQNLKGYSKSLFQEVQFISQPKDEIKIDIFNAEIKSEFEDSNTTVKASSQRQVGTKYDSNLQEMKENIKLSPIDVKIDDNLPIDQVTPCIEFQGFATASGKKVEISQEAILAAKKRYAEIETDTDLKQAIPTKPAEFQGFATASGKKVEISQEAILAAKKRYAEIKTVPDLEQVIPSRPAEFQGFATASGKKVEISQEAIRAAKKRYAEIETDTEQVIPSRPAEFQGFATASGKKVEISQEAILAAKKRYAEIEIDTDLKQVIPSGPAEFKGFATASGKKVDISQEAILAAKKRYTEIETGTDLKQAIPTKPAEFQGFATASGKKVEISQEAIRAAKKRYAEIETDTDLKQAKPSRPAEFQGFATASGKKVEISQEAILAAKKMFANNESDVSNEQTQPIKSSHGFQGFCTASGSKVTISEEAILAAKKRFIENDDDFMTEPKSHVFQGFCTASGNKVTISEEAILAAKQKLQETQSEQSLKTTAGFQGFATASGRKVSVSEKAILEAKIRMNEISCENVTEEIITSKRKFEEVDTDETNFEALITENKVSRTKLIEDSDSQNISINIAPVSETSEYESSQSQAPKSPILGRRIKLSIKTKKIFIAEREKQKLKIKSKNKEDIKPIAGNILKIRRSQCKLLKLKNISTENSQENSQPRAEVMNINSINAQNYRFKCIQMITCEDGAIVIPSNNGEVGYEEIESAFLASPGVDPKLIPPGGWIKNHYRWIVWKLASTERRFPNQFMNYLSLENVMSQLKFRYDREMDLAQRPAIKRITEQDSPPSLTIILCVAEIHLVPNSEYIILTDNWYSIKTKIDEEMLRLIRKKQIVEGTKLIIHGAEFINKFEACHPLQQPQDLAIKISTNSTRRARWDALLGFYKDPSPINITLDSVLPYGGLIGEMWCSVARVYPVMYAEHFQQNDGVNKTVIRGERAEKLYSERYEVQRQKMMERIVAEEKSKMYKEKEKEAGRRRHSFCAGDLRDGETLCLALESDPDLHTSLTDSQRDIASEYNREVQQRWSTILEDKIRERMKLEKIKQRSISMLIKIRLVPVNSYEPSAILTIWRPDQEIIKLIQSENAVIKIYNCYASGRRNGELCINTTKNTKILDACPIELNPLLNRNVTPICELDNYNFKPVFSEVDLVGIVSNIEPIQGNNLQLVTLCDASGYQVIITFYGGIESQGLSQLLIPGVSISCINLQWRKGIKKSISNDYATLPCLQASEFSQFSREPNENYLKIALQDLRSNLDPDVTIKNIKRCINTTNTIQKNNVDKSSSENVHKRMNALARYGDPPPISSLPVFKVPEVLFQSFQAPSRVVSEDDSPPMSLSQ